jgi:hypothetical protein
MSTSKPLSNFAGIRVRLGMKMELEETKTRGSVKEN